MIADELIIKGFCSFNENITKEYFYGFCRKAYDVYDHKYQLSNKTGLDFYSLAHEYYISLLMHDFKPLLDRPIGMKLSTWMMNGFRFVVLDALKAYNKEFASISDAAADNVLEFIRSDEYESGMIQQIIDAVTYHYKNDKTMTLIANSVLYEGYPQKDVAARLGMTPAAVNQRYKKMMDEVITPYVIENYSEGLYRGAMYEIEAEDTMPVMGAMPAHKSAFRARFMMEISEKQSYMKTDHITPDEIISLKKNEIFVFGSNLQGMHAGGAAYTARMLFGAKMGQGVGLQGQSYAIPTMQGGVETIKPYVDKFLEFAGENPNLDFLVTRIGCGIAGFSPEDIAPLFKKALHMHNVWLPADFWKILEKRGY